MDAELWVVQDHYLRVAAMVVVVSQTKLFFI
jgi:hypothetical protein